MKDMFEDLEHIPLDLNLAVWLNESIGIDSPVGATTMPKSLSGDLRERVIEAVQAGASRREAGERFEISASAAVKWLQRWRDHGVCVAKPRGGSRSILEDHAERILALAGEQPDRTLDELVAAMRKRRIPGSRSALWRFLDRHDITFKKSLRAAEQHRADVARARRRWIRQQGYLDTTRLVFIDETAVTINMVRLRGRCPRGERLISHVPQGAWKTITFVAALRHNKMVAPMVLGGPINGAAPSMRHREAQMGDAGFEVVHEAGNRAIVLAAIVGNDPGRELARNSSARRLIGRLRADLELRPDVFRHLGRQVVHAMGQATLPGRPRKANFDRLDDARSAIRGHQ